MNKEKIALLVDSGTDVPAEIMSQYGMYMLPLQIIYKDRTYTDKVDITAEEIYQRLPQEIPSTSLPDGETINKIFDRIKADFRPFILIRPAACPVCCLSELLNFLPSVDTAMYVLNTNQKTPAEVHDCLLEEIIKAYTAFKQDQFK